MKLNLLEGGEDGKQNGIRFVQISIILVMQNGFFETYSVFVASCFPAGNLIDFDLNFEFLFGTIWQSLNRVKQIHVHAQLILEQPCF